MFFLDKYKTLFMMTPNPTNPPIVNLPLALIAPQMEVGNPTNSRFLNKTRQLLLQNYRQGFASIEMVADWLHLTPRTLQRRLQEEGYTFRSLLNELKLALSVQLLQSQQYSVTDVAYYLGFSETGSFSRSFRKWTGQAPTQYLQAS